MTDFVTRANRMIALGFSAVSAAHLAELREEQGKPAVAVATPFPKWNRACRGQGGGAGLGRGWYVILTGRTGAGKTLAALNMVVRALRDGTGVLYVSLEMSADELLTRLRPIVSGTDVTRLEWGAFFRPEAALAADEAILRLPGALYLNTEPIYKLTDIREAVAHYAALGVRLVVLDYAQLVVPNGSDRKLFEAMTTISAELRYAAREHGVTAVVLSQLNRAETREAKQPPTLEGLYGSGRFAFDADQVLALDYSQRQRDPIRRTERTRLLLLKNRHGPTLQGDSAIGIEIDYSTFRVSELESDRVL